MTKFYSGDDYKILWESNERKITRLKRRTLQAEENAKKTSAAALIEKTEIETIQKKIEFIEEELKCYNKVKADNERLKAENRALIRVVNKLNNLNVIKMS